MNKALFQVAQPELITLIQGWLEKHPEVLAPHDSFTIDVRADSDGTSITFKEPSELDAILDQNIRILEQHLPSPYFHRIITRLDWKNIHSIRDLLKLSRKDVECIRNIGSKSIAILENALRHLHPSLYFGMLY